jgi:Leucine-rich repeat (LRR) protein
MLGPDRLNFETPNVIDPGDRQPSAPPRVSKACQSAASSESASSTHSNSSTSSSGASDPQQQYQYQHDRESTARLLTDIADLDLSPSSQQCDPYDPYEEDEDEEQGGKSSSARNSGSNHHSLPSVEAARFYAATLLNQSSNKKPSPKECQPLSLGRTVPIDTSRHLVRKRILHYASRLGLVLVGVVLILVVGIVTLDRRNNSNNNNNSTYPSKAAGGQSARHFDIATFLVRNNVSRQVDLTTDGTPQFLAANWMADEDGLQLPIPTNLYTDYRFVQRYVLTVFFFAMNGVLWTDRANFLTLQDECSWFTTKAFDHFIADDFAVGVTCDPTNLQVRGLYLPSNNLVNDPSSLPTELQHLSQLQMLGLSNNDVQGSIPMDWKNLKHLEFIDLKYNRLTGTLPDWIGDLTGLQVLGLSNNDLSGPVPNSFATLNRLKTLAVDDNRFTGSIDFVNTLTNLEYFYAERNRFKGRLDSSFLANLDRIRELDLSANDLTGTELPVHLFHYPNLHVLDLADNRLAARFPEEIGDNSELDFFSLRGNQMYGTLPSSIYQFSSLSHLDLYNNSFTGDMPKDLDKITDLTYLSLGENDFAPFELPPFLVTLSNLRELSLAATHLTGTIPVWLGSYLPHLKLLDLSRNHLTSSVPETVFTKMKDLQYLLLDHNALTGNVPDISRISSNDASAAAPPQLKILSLHRNPGLSGAVSCLTGIDLIAVDCTSISCTGPCCPSCCQPDDNICFEDELGVDLSASQGMWEFQFDPTPFGFDPDILDETGLFAILSETDGDP